MTANEAQKVEFLHIDGDIALLQLKQLFGIKTVYIAARKSVDGLFYQFFRSTDLRLVEHHCATAASAQIYDSAYFGF